MNNKNEKGLSMIAVIIVLAVIIATIFETIIIAKKWTQEADVDDLTTTMLSIQARCKTYKDKEVMEKDKNNKKDTNITTNSSKDNTKNDSKNNSSKNENKDNKTEDNKIEKELKGQLISEIEDNEVVKSLIEKNVFTEDEKYYLLSEQDLEALHVYEIDPSQIFLVNYDTEEVVYANGIERGNEVLYKLSEINN